MDLGLAVFLSSVFIGTIWLYSITKDEWNWKKISKWIIVVFLMLVIVFIAFDFFTDGVIDGDFIKRRSTFY